MNSENVAREAIDDLEHGVEIGNIIFQMPEDEEIIATMMVALKKRISQKVVDTYHVMVGDIDVIEYGECPSCGHTGLQKHTHEHCWWCGQKLDWE